MTFAKPKVSVRMRRKAWRPLNLGIDTNGLKAKGEGDKK